jgi:vacuolar-type H+-ATPase subunit H
MLNEVLSWMVVFMPFAISVVPIFIPTRHEDERVYMRWRYILVGFGIVFSILAWWQQSQSIRAAAEDRKNAIIETSRQVAAETSKQVTKAVTEQYSQMIADQKSQISDLRTRLAAQGKDVSAIKSSNIVSGKSPIKVEVINPASSSTGESVPPPHVADVRLNWERQDSVRPDAPYCQKVILQSDVSINPVGFLISFSAPIKSVTTLGIRIAYQGEFKIDGRDQKTIRIAAMGIGDALLKPDYPLAILVCSDQDFKPLKLTRAVVQ